MDKFEREAVDARAMGSEVCGSLSGGRDLGPVVTMVVWIPRIMILTAFLFFLLPPTSDMLLFFLYFSIVDNLRRCEVDVGRDQVRGTGFEKPSDTGNSVGKFGIMTCFFTA